MNMKTIWAYLSYFIIAMVVLSLPLRAYADTLSPFTSDGCSMFPDGTPDDSALWTYCCIEHDVAYWLGGTKHQRVQADIKLEQCVAKQGKPNIAKLMHQGVTVGGSPYLPTFYRWGYGWPYLRGYKPLSSEEKRQAIEALKKSQSILFSWQRKLEQKTHNKAPSK